VSHLRWNPVLREWVIVSPARHKRPVLGKEGCPFCPGSEETKGNWKVLTLPNRYPALSQDSETTPSEGGYVIRSAKGLCEVVVTSRRHDDRMDTMSIGQIVKVLSVFAGRTRALSGAQHVKYVYVFENFGPAIGVTLTHPHAQIYAMPFIPPIVRRELSSARQHRKSYGRCLFCTILGREISSRTRLVDVNEHFVAFIPFYARWAFEVHVYPRRHVGFLFELSPSELSGLARLLRRVVSAFNTRYGFPFSYVMALHQAPVGGDRSFHFHIEFYPPHREGDKLKHLAGIEQGVGTFLADTLPEERAGELRSRDRARSHVNTIDTPR
jgi:UDPglucose--hexose-1-phosphate uridylyltransferase